MPRDGEIERKIDKSTGRPAMRVLSFDEPLLGPHRSQVIISASRQQPNDLINLTIEADSGRRAQVRLSLAGAAAIAELIAELIELAGWSGIAHIRDPKLEDSL